MKIGGQTPNRVRFGLLACQLLPKATEEEEQIEVEVDEPHAKKQKPTSDPTWWALGDVIIPKVCGDTFRYEVDSFGSFKSSSAEGVPFGHGTRAPTSRIIETNHGHENKHDISALWKGPNVWRRKLGHEIVALHEPLF